MSFDAMWSALESVGRHPRTGGYRRFAWTRDDMTLREWFAGEASARGLDLVQDRAGNQWAWWGDPDAAVAAGRPGLVLGSHLDSVPDGGAFDGPLGVVSALAALDVLMREGFRPARPIGVASFADEEGARFGIACAGSRLLTGQLDPDRARALRDADGVTMAEAMAEAGHDPAHLGADPETLRRVGTFVELHVEQGRGLVDLDRPVGVGAAIWPHGRWRLDLRGEANHAGTTPLEDRHDPMLALASAVLAARAAAQAHGCVATVGKVAVEPGGVNAIPSRVTAWLDARGPFDGDVRKVVASVGAQAGVEPLEESWTPETAFDAGLAADLSRVLDAAPVLSTGAGHDAGVLATAGAVDGDAVRAQPDRGLALTGGARRDRGLPPGRRRARAGGPRAGRMSDRPSGAGTPTTRCCPRAPRGTSCSRSADGRFTAVTPDSPRGRAERLAGVVLPGLANAHSHAFHRALRGRTHGGGGTFWTWREGMYAVAARLDPDTYLALARATYAEMALAGITCVGEFHYLHHAPGGTAYDDPNAMGEALTAGGPDAGIRLTLLDTCYLAGGLTADGHPRWTQRQRRFGDTTAERWAERLLRSPVRGDARRRGDPLGAGGAAGEHRRRGRRRRGDAVARAPVRAAGRERGVPGVLRHAPRPRCCRRRARSGRGPRRSTPRT